MVFIFAYNCGTLSCLENAPERELDLWRSTVLISEVLAELLGIFHSIKSKKTLALKLGCFTARDALPLTPNYDSRQIRSL